MYGAGEVFGGFQSSLDECLVDDYLRGNVCQFTSLPRFYLLSHRLEVSLHSVNTNRDTVDERERLRVFSKDGGEETWDNIAKFSDAKAKPPPTRLLDHR